MPRLPNARDLISLPEAAAFAGYRSASTLRKAAREGTLGTMILGPRAIMHPGVGPGLRERHLRQGRPAPRADPPVARERAPTESVGAPAPGGPAPASGCARPRGRPLEPRFGCGDQVSERRGLTCFSPDTWPSSPTWSNQCGKISREATILHGYDYFVRQYAWTWSRCGRVLLDGDYAYLTAVNRHARRCRLPLTRRPLRSCSTSECRDGRGRGQPTAARRSATATIPIIAMSAAPHLLAPPRRSRTAWSRPSIWRTCMRSSHGGCGHDEPLP